VIDEPSVIIKDVYMGVKNNKDKKSMRRIE
jgi:hypothetical protein